MMKFSTRLLASVVLLTLGVAISAQNAVENQVQSKFAGPVRITKLLWKVNPKNAAQTLNGVIESGLERQQIPELRSALAPLESAIQAVLEAEDSDDARWSPSLAAKLLQSDSDAELNEHVANTLSADSGDFRRILFRVWLSRQPESAFAFFGSKLNEMNDASMVSEMITDTLRMEPDRGARLLFVQWNQLSPEIRTLAIEPLSSSADSMEQLISAVARGDVQKDRVNTNQLRKWLMGDPERWRPKVEPVWGVIRESNNAERQALVRSTLQLLRSGVSGSAANGEAMFMKVCSQCHLLHGKGFEVGPNITGNGRGSLEQLVSNVLDPSLVIGEAFVAKTVLTFDGNVISGLVVEETDQYLRLKVQGGKTVELDKTEDIELLKTSTKSLMPEGVEAQMSQQELVDLFSFLCLLKPLGSEANSLIPGTPSGFVRP